MTSILKEFRDFLLRGNLLVLAVAFVMGAAFAALVTAFVTDLVMPVIAAIFGKVDFSSLMFTINHSVFLYGSFITALIVFVSVAAAVLPSSSSRWTCSRRRTRRIPARATRSGATGAARGDPGARPLAARAGRVAPMRR